MGTVTHSHKILKDNSGPHVDSAGVAFGHDEHTEAAGSVKAWPTDGIPVVEVKHKHTNVSINPMPEQMMDIWTFEGNRVSRDVDLTKSSRSVAGTPNPVQRKDVFERANVAAEAEMGTVEEASK